MARIAAIDFPHLLAEIGLKTESARTLNEKNLVQEALARIAESALLFGPTVSFETRSHFENDTYTVSVDITGCAHLWATETDAIGERRLVAALAEAISAMGHTGRVAVAEGARVAEAFARHWPMHRRRDGKPDFAPIVVPFDKTKVAFARLPICALPVGSKLLEWLRHLGLHKIGDLQQLPRAELAVRIGENAREIMALIDADDSAPLNRYDPPTIVEERFELEYGTESSEAIAFVAKGLSARVSPRLRGRGCAARRIELILSLDRAMSETAEQLIVCELASPLESADDIFAVLRLKIDALQLSAPVRAVLLRVAETVPIAFRSLQLFSPEAKAERSLPRLVAELSTELGSTNIGVLSLIDSWRPDRRSELVPYSPARTKSPEYLSVNEAAPVRLCQPVRVLVDTAAVECVLNRVEAAEWWKVGWKRLDFAAVWLPTGGLAWVEMNRAERRGWFD